MGLPASSAQAVERSLLQPNSNFVPNLDFLRALAIALVVIDHTCLALHRPVLYGWDAAFLGNLGVWIFFVHTALVLLWSLERKPYTLDFYVRRLFRVYPLAILAILTGVLFRAPLLGTVQDFFQYHPTSTPNLVATLLLVYNLAPPLWHWNQVVNVIWTLPFEVDMYLVLPILFAFVRRDLKLWPILLLWALAVAHCLNYFSTELNFASAIPDFLGGVVAYIGFRRFAPRVPGWLFPLFLAALIALTMHQPQLPLAWPFTLAIGLALPHFRQLRASFFTTACHRIAKYSYGVYLWHPFGLVLGIYLLPHRPVALQLAVELLFTAVAAVAGYHVLEKPMIDLGSRQAARLERHSLTHNAAHAL